MRLLSTAAVTVATLAGQSFPGGPAIDQAVNEAIQQDRLPGAVVLVGHNGHVVYRQAYGNRALVPRTEPMTADTIFDCASLTKVIATTPSLMKLFEQGRFRLNDKVTAYIPEFQGGNSDITLRNLFTHFSGLAPDVPLQPPWTGNQTGLRLAYTTKPTGPPGARCVYSDINFILLGELVHRLTGQTLAEYARRNIFEALGMNETTFLPPASWIPRIAPTERPEKTALPLRGVVHDPTARNMGGVAGHAGVFSTADDLARFAQMMLNGGELDGVRLFDSLTVARFTEPQTPPDQPVLRGLGWDIDSPYSSARGALFPLGSYGHTGFTGTSIWIDPSTRTYVILLANSVHPDARPSLGPLRAKVATIVAGAVGIQVRGTTLPGSEEVASRGGAHFGRNTHTGLDVLVGQRFQPLAGKRVGLITNQTGVDREGRRNVDLMRQAGIAIAALFAPEHGLLGVEDRPGIEDSTDRATGIKVFSLYGKTLRPTPEMLRGIDALVFDIQSAGVRFYTYETTMAYAMEAAAKAGIPFYVLDRPNPITGLHVEGPLLDKDNQSFVGYFAGMPVRHGMTMGELASLYNAEKKIGAALTVIPVEGWQRSDWFDFTNLPWTDLSPNLRSLNAAILYPGLCLLEYGNISVGRGTGSPFEQIGADFIGGRELAAYLYRRQIPGVRFYPTSFTPASSNFKGVRIEGVRFRIVDRDALDATRLGLEVAAAIQKLYPGEIDWAVDKKLIGSDAVVRQLQSGEDPQTIEQAMQDGVAGFLKLRDKYLIYR
jgi:uncharacterized protein YbbC (DUF1343 family)/CubicO group peptidase (beta-lactamase class C family)